MWIRDAIGVVRDAVMGGWGTMWRLVIVMVVLVGCAVLYKLV